MLAIFENYNVCVLFFHVTPTTTTNTKEDWTSQDHDEYSHFSGYGWIVHSAIIIYLVAYHVGIGPLGWIIVVEFIPCRAPVEAGISAVSSCWWAFNLAFTMKLVHLTSASSMIKLPGLCAIYAVVACLLYALVLQTVPRSKVTYNRSLCQIERYSYKRYTLKKERVDGDDPPKFNDNSIDLQKADLTTSSSETEGRTSSSSTTV